MLRVEENDALRMRILRERGRPVNLHTALLVLLLTMAVWQDAQPAQPGTLSASYRTGGFFL